MYLQSVASTTDIVQRSDQWKDRPRKEVEVLVQCFLNMPTGHAATFYLARKSPGEAAAHLAEWKPLLTKGAKKLFAP